MNCEVVRKKLFDFLEGSVSNDLHEAIENHLNTCDSCRKIYEEEKELDELIKASLNTEHIEFKSSRSEIMKSIDKDRYSKSPWNKLRFHFKKYGKQYLASAACLIFFLAMSPLIRNEFNKADNLERASEDAKIEKRTLEPENIRSFDANTKNLSEEKGTLQKEKNESTVFFDKKVQFIREEVKDEKQIEFNTPWVESPNKKFKATIEGKGPYAVEEGIATVVIKEMDSNKIMRYSIIPDQKQLTPKYIQWLDDENLLLIIGFPYGTVTKGGNLYMLNMQSNNNYLVYETKDEKKEVTSLEKINRDGTLDLKLNLNVYEDEEFNKFHKETVTLENFRVIFDK
ncbi:DUF4652 domain-containing protein [Clostridium sp. MSJ-11]|uniref:DUF4652 domain-containing protein n=1 Tax=Clostridium mobile TaxID=2841512 RepID=A0ABS6EIM9_9CLOT|nr:DUF4652 domain-containing protein [Clostridium mobile]MBU5485084.1 DUF4652 domain-containing protein [Clostridium mobile]